MKNGNDSGQIQLLEVLMIALFVFIAYSVVATFRLPTSPQTFQDAELRDLASGTLEARQLRGPTSTDDCNDTPCPFNTDLERLISLAMGYRGPTLGSGESADSAELRRYLEEALPAGTQYLVIFSNGYNLTRLAPQAATPPLETVVVARTFITPNWTVHSSKLTESVVLRIGELTGWGTPAISDPLNRTASEWGHTWTSLFSSRVPINATFGTYQACSATGCRYFTVAPPGIIGAGGQILNTDRDPAATVRINGTWTNIGAYEDTAPVGLSAGDPIYLDTNGNRLVGVGDFRVTPVANCRGTVTCEAGSYVRTGDNDIGRVLLGAPVTAKLALQSSDAVTSEGEGVYLDVDDNNLVGTDDVRLTRVGLYGMGTRVAAGQTDVGGSLANEYTAAEIDWADADGDITMDEGEAVYLNLNGLGQTVGLDPYDVHLTPVGVPGSRNLYSVELAVWYGA